LRGSTRIVMASSTMQELLKLVARFAGSDAPVAVLGETGTGKEVVARLLHANSPRARQPFIAVNVAALPAELLESELFGHGKGAYTGASSARRGLFEAANGGTLFLDEIGEMAPPLQAKLLRVLQDGEVRRVGENTTFAVDARIICATHRDLVERVREGTFREDLFYRLKVLTLHVPPLRARRDDIIPLAQHFLDLEKRDRQSFSTAAKARLLSYSWPGNVRELQNVVKYAAAVATDDQVHDRDLPDEVRSASVARRQGRSDGPDTSLTLAEVERKHILSVLDACGGSQTEAAGVLGVARNTLWRKIRRYT
jgi:DNA-binding NtrC family response regulator